MNAYRKVGLAAGAIAVADLAWWAFTGIPLWAPLSEGEAVRAAVLIGLHVAPCFAAMHVIVEG